MGASQHCFVSSDRLHGRLYTGLTSAQARGCSLDQRTRRAQAGHALVLDVRAALRATTEPTTVMLSPGGWNVGML